MLQFLRDLAPTTIALAKKGPREPPLSPAAAPPVSLLAKGSSRSELLFRCSRAGIRGRASPRAAGVLSAVPVGEVRRCSDRHLLAIPRRHSMRGRYRFFLPLLLLFFVAAPASAQHMFL